MREFEYTNDLGKCEKIIGESEKDEKKGLIQSDKHIDRNRDDWEI